MDLSKFDEKIISLKARHFPDGSIELLKAEETYTFGFFEFGKRANQIVIEYEEKVLLISNIRPDLFLKLEVNKKNYNIGMLNKIASRISIELCPKETDCFD